MNDQSKRFLTVLRRGNKDERLGLLQEMPSSSMRDAASRFLESEKKEMQVMALNTLVTSYGFGQAAGLAGDLARAAYAFGREVFDQQGPKGSLMLFTVSAIASSGLHAFNLIGRYSESVAFANEVIPDLEAFAEDPNLPDIYAHRIEALVGLHRVDEAWQRLEEARKRQKHSVHLPRLKKNLEDLMQPPWNLPPDQRGRHNDDTR